MRNQLLTNANIGANVLFNQILVFVNYFVKRLLNAQVWLMMSVNIIALAGLSLIVTNTSTYLTLRAHIDRMLEGCSTRKSFRFDRSCVLLSEIESQTMLQSFYIFPFGPGQLSLSLFETTSFQFSLPPHPKPPIQL